MFHALAVTSGCRYGSTATWLSRWVRVVWAPSQPSVAIVSYQVPPIFSSSGWGIATWSHTAM